VRLKIQVSPEIWESAIREKFTPDIIKLHSSTPEETKILVYAYEKFEHLIQND
jgi:hypothetical protein